MCSAAAAAAPVGVQVIVIRNIVIVMADARMLAVKKRWRLLQSSFLPNQL
jgi:hypothetical protein